MKSKLVEIREGYFKSKMALDSFKLGLPEEAKILREGKLPFGYDEWQITYWLPESKFL